MKCAATYEGVGQDAGWLEHCAADPRGYREEMGFARAARGRAATTARASIVEGDSGERKRKEGGSESRCVVKYVCGSRVGSPRRIARKSTLAISRTCGALLHQSEGDGEASLSRVRRATSAWRVRTARCWPTQG